MNPSINSIRIISVSLPQSVFRRIWTWAVNFREIDLGIQRFSMLDAFCKIRMSDPQPPEYCSVNLAGCDQRCSLLWLDLTIEEDWRSFEKWTIRGQDIVLGCARFSYTKSVSESQGSGYAAQCRTPTI